MDIFEIDGPVQLSGTIEVAGSKNSTLPIMASMLLAPGTSTIPNAPDLADIRSLETLLNSLGAKTNRDEGGLHIDAGAWGLSVTRRNLQTKEASSKTQTNQSR